MYIYFQIIQKVSELFRERSLLVDAPHQRTTPEARTTPRKLPRRFNPLRIRRRRHPEPQTLPIKPQRFFFAPRTLQATELPNRLRCSQATLKTVGPTHTRRYGTPSK